MKDMAQADREWMKVNAADSEEASARERESLVLGDEFIVPATPIPNDPSDVVGSSMDREEGPNSVVEVPKGRVASSGTMGCILGCLIGGPVLAVMSSIGCMYAATHDEGATGDVARALGDVGIATKQKVSRLNDDHQIVSRTSQFVARTYEKGVELEQNHHVCERTGKAIVAGGKRVVDFVHRNRVIERSAMFTASSLQYVAGQISCNENRAEAAHDNESKSDK